MVYMFLMVSDGLVYVYVEIIYVFSFILISCKVDGFIRVFVNFFFDGVLVDVMLCCFIFIVIFVLYMSI